MSDDLEKAARDAKGLFLPGNQFWKARTSVPGVKRKYQDPEDLTTACEEYFQWVADNPLSAPETVTHQGKGDVFFSPRMRAMTAQALCSFIGVTHRSWMDWKQKDGKHYRADLSQVIAWAEAIIYQQKFEGASAGLLNANIIARDLKLRDGSELTGKDGGAIQTESKTTIDPTKISEAAALEILNARLDV